MSSKLQYLGIIGLIIILTIAYFMLSKQTPSQNEGEGPETIFVTLKTSMGDIELELYKKDMPITVGNFVELAEGDFYDGVKFHRVIQGFMNQAGDPKTKDDALMDQWGTGGPGYAIQDEFVAGLSNLRGTIAMANAGPNTGGSQWFINIADNTNLDFDKPPASSMHPVFGRVVGGMDVVDAINNVETTGRPFDRPLEAIVIEDVVIKK
jgi:peptidylprolyl isomerase